MPGSRRQPLQAESPGTVSFLQPSVDAQTRTMTARIQVPNPGMRLRPGMFVQVAFEAPVALGTVASPALCGAQCRQGTGRLCR